MDKAPDIEPNLDDVVIDGHGYSVSTDNTFQQTHEPATPDTINFAGHISRILSVFLILFYFYIFRTYVNFFGYSLQGCLTFRLFWISSHEIYGMPRLPLILHISIEVVKALCILSVILEMRFHNSFLVSFFNNLLSKVRVAKLLSYLLHH